MAEFFDILLDFSSKFGYFGIVFLMAVESSFIPFPSEIIIPPAAYLASQGEFSIGLVVLSGIIGSLIGASINYILAISLGRKIVYAIVQKKISRIFLITETKMLQAEEYFLKYGNISTFFGRLIPVIRQLISIPAGFSKMNFGSFLFYTAIGSGIWTVILAIMGYTLGANKELLASYYSNMKLYIWGTVLFTLVALAIRFIRKKNRAK